MSFLRFARKSFRTNQPARAKWAQLFLETLEDRITPDVTLFPGGHLVVNGDDGGPRDDTIAVDDNGSGGVMVTAPGIIAGFTPGEVTSIEVNPGGGINLVNLNAIPSGVPVTVNCASSAFDDHIILGNAPKNLDLLRGEVTVNGNGGGAPSTDTVILLDKNNVAAAIYTITANSVNRPNFAGLTYSGINRLSLVGGLASDTYNLNTAADILYTIEGNSPSDTFNLGTGNLHALKGEETIISTGEAAADRVILHDEANPLDDGYDFETSTAPGDIPVVSVSGSGFHVLVQSPISVRLNAGPGDNTFFVSALQKNLDFLTNPLVLDGGGGSNALVVNDTNAPAGENYIVSSGFFQRTGGPAMSLSGVQAMTVDGGNHGTTFGVPSTSNGSAVTLNMGTGFNTVTVGNPDDDLGEMQGRLAVVGASLGFTELTLDDRANTAGRTFLVQSDRVLLGLGQVDYSRVESLTLDGGNGPNRFAIQSTPATMSTTINAGTAVDSIHAGEALLGEVGPIQGPLTINGQGNTTVTVFDQSTASVLSAAASRA